MSYDMFAKEYSGVRIGLDGVFVDGPRSWSIPLNVSLVCVALIEVERAYRASINMIELKSETSCEGNMMNTTIDNAWLRPFYSPKTHRIHVLSDLH